MNESRRIRRELLVAKQRRRDLLRGLEAERKRVRHNLISNAQARRVGGSVGLSINS